MNEEKYVNTDRIHRNTNVCDEKMMYKNDIKFPEVYCAMLE